FGVPGGGDRLTGAGRPAAASDEEHREDRDHAAEDDDDADHGDEHGPGRQHGLDPTAMLAAALRRPCVVHSGASVVYLGRAWVAPFAQNRVRAGASDER